MKKSKRYRFPPLGPMQVEADGAYTTYKCPDCSTCFAKTVNNGFTAPRFEYPIVCCGKMRVSN